MRILIKLMLPILVLSFFGKMNGQNLQTKYKYLAHYSILNYLLDNQIRDGQDIHIDILPSILYQVKETIQKDNFLYKIELIDTLCEYEFISIIDSTNFQLHGLNETIWAINQNDNMYGNYIISEDLNFDSFINKYLYENISKYNKLSIIRIYNKIENRDPKIEFFAPTKNLDRFKAIEKEYRLISDYRYNKLSKSTSYKGTPIYTYETFFRLTMSDDVYYYHLMFEFYWNRFKVTKTLIYKNRV